MSLNVRQLMVACATLYLAVIVLLVLGIRHSTGGHFIYALDDPYIHLALAENLAQGHYGINAGEAASPSSSILWPYLLVPFAGTFIHPYLPLAWCVLFGTGASMVFGWMICRWQTDAGGKFPLNWYQQVLFGGLLILAANLASLTIVGMEHVLQIFLTICCAIAVTEALAGRRLAGWMLVAAVFAPAVRYEDVSLTLAVCCALAAQKRWKAAIATMSLALAPLAAFSFFLKSRGLPLLPLSVLIKADAYAHNSTPTIHLSEMLRRGIALSISMDRMPVTVLTLTLVWLTLRARTSESRTILASAALVGVAQMLIGRFNWFHRYEVYAQVFLLLVILGQVIRTTELRYRYCVASLALLGVTYGYATLVTVTAATKIYRQQYQMHRFVTEYYQGNYAVNDLGLTSFERRPGTYVLDLFGLGSLEAATQKDKSATWLQSVVEKHDAKLAMIYPSWFGTLPNNWAPIATMCEEPSRGIGSRLSQARPCMVYYSTALTAHAEIRQQLRLFSTSLPPRVTMRFEQESSP